MSTENGGREELKKGKGGELLKKRGRDSLRRKSKEKSWKTEDWAYRKRRGLIFPGDTLETSLTK